jgi:hypothetical protein
MRAHAWTLVAAFCLSASIGGCKKPSTDASSSSSGFLGIVASKSKVVANGTNTVTLTVTNTAGGSVTVTTNRGTFSTGGTSATVPGASGTLTLVTCDATTDATCAGTALVSASGASNAASASIIFGTLSTMCSSDCTVDAGCATLACTGASGAGTCSGTVPSTCVVSGGPPPPPGASLRLGSIQLTKTPVQFPVQGARGSGVNEVGWLQVQVLDDAGNPYPDGLDVRFEHKPLGGSTLSSPLMIADTAACKAASGCIQVPISSGTGTASGLATAYLHSGDVAGTLAVTVSATAGGVTVTAVLPTVAVVGAKANGANFSIVCSPRNVPALAETDCGVSWVDAPFTCEALLKDRFGNLLGTATQVIFASEAAGVAPFATTPAYDPTKDPLTQNALGTAVEIFNTLGAGLPFDVAPQAGEPSAVVVNDRCGTTLAPNVTHNPRDGVVTVVAIADGEEAFFDSNGNGVYDVGEPFIDQGEPFVDANDNGVFDGVEPFTDSNGNGVYDLGEPFKDFNGNGVRDATPNEWFLDVDGNGFYTPPNGVWDGNGKIWTQTVVVYSGDPATVAAGGLNFLGTRWSAAAVSACTPTPRDPGFAVNIAQTTPVAIPATSQTHYVYASDMNLNRLDGASSFDVSVGTGTITAKYFGLASYADDLGLFYRYWPCDQAGVCASQCRSTGAALPCVMKPAITSFGCGIGAAVVVTGSSSSDGAALDEVDWNVSTPHVVFDAYTKTILSVKPLAGNNN